MNLSNWPLDKFISMRSIVLYICIVTYGTIKNLCSTNSCNKYLTCIVCINKSHAEMCRFTVVGGWDKNSESAVHSSFPVDSQAAMTGATRCLLVIHRCLRPHEMVDGKTLLSARHSLLLPLLKSNTIV